MKLASARALKQSLFSGELRALVRDPLGIEGYALAAESRTRKELPQPTIALGIARRSKDDFRLAVRIQDRAFEVTDHVDRIRKAARGEVEVRYVGWVDKQLAPWNQQRVRPLQIATSVGHERVTAGTLGCFVKDAKGVVYVLSNNHVLADENAGTQGDAILQQGKADGGNLKNRMARLSKFVRLVRPGVNRVDAALARVNDGQAYDAKTLRGLGQLQAAGGAQLSIGQRVAKVGRTTDLTRGKVTAFDIDNLTVGYGIGAVRFDGQIEIEGSGTAPFSRGGDSGSLIVDAELRGIALLFAGSDQGGSNGYGLTFANPLSVVLSELAVTLVT